MHTRVQSSIIHNIPKVETAQMSVHWRTDRQSGASLQAVECYSTVEENEVLIHALTKMSLGSILLNERSHTHGSRVLCGSIYRKCPEQASL